MHADEAPRGFQTWNVPKGGTFSWSRVEEALENQGWSVADLARASGVPASTLSRWSTGEYEPRLEQLFNVARALLLTIDVLVQGTDMPDLSKQPAGILSKPESDLVRLYRRNERFRRIVNNVIEELRLNPEVKE